jgi:succinate dehydrogenase/fumarate reductase flavoprotein subunit
LEVVDASMVSVALALTAEGEEVGVVAYDASDEDRIIFDNVVLMVGVTEVVEKPSTLRGWCCGIGD